MARLTKMPSQAIIDGFKGVIDFYLWMGIPVARKWPVYKVRQPHYEEWLNQQDFKRINQAAPFLPVKIITAYEQLAQGTPFTWKDLLVRTFMRGLWS